MTDCFDSHLVTQTSDDVDTTSLMAPSHVELVTPQIGNIPSIVIYTDCVNGSCKCSHFIGGVSSQLQPCRAAPFLFGDSALPAINEEDRLFL